MPLDTPTYRDLQDGLQASIIVQMQRSNIDVFVDVDDLRANIPAIQSRYVLDRDLEIALRSLFRRGLIRMTAGLNDGRLDIDADISGFITFSPLDATDISACDPNAYKEFVSKQNNSSVVRLLSKQADAFATQYVEDIYSALDNLEPVRYFSHFQEIDLLQQSNHVQNLNQSLDIVLTLLRTSNSPQIRSSNNVTLTEDLLLEAKKELSASKTTVGRLEGLIYGALGYLAAAFADEPIGEAARTAWAAARPLLMSAF